MADTLDAALESLRRELFYEEMARAESDLGGDAAVRAQYERERTLWLDTDLSASQFDS